MTSSFFLTRWFFLAMRWVYESLCNAVAWKASYVIVITIFLFTVAIRLLTVGTDVSSRKSSAKMAAIQPDLQKLQKKYGNDPQKLNMEQKKFMADHGVSMFGGCLPMLITLPLFFIFINAFRAWSNEQTLHLLLTMSEDPEAGFQLFASYKFLWINNIWRPDNLSDSVVLTAEQFWTTFASAGKNGIANYIYYAEHQQAFETLLQSMHFFDENMQIVADNTEFIAEYNRIMGPCIEQYVTRVNGYAILPILAGASTFLQSWLAMKNTPQQADANGNNSGKTMMYMMPLLTVFFCWKYDSTFSLYWIISNLVAIVVTLVLNKKMPDIIARDEAKRQAKAKAKEAK